MYKDFAGMIPEGREIIFVCIGTDRSTGDSFGPLVGERLKSLGYNVLGTLEYPVTAVNVNQIMNQLKQKYPNHFIIGVDAALGRVDSVGKVYVKKGAIKPGKGVGKAHLDPVGDLGLLGVVNVGGFLPHLVLQNTRLFKVFQMVDKAAEIVASSVPKPKNKIDLTALLKVDPEIKQPLKTKPERTASKTFYFDRTPMNSGYNSNRKGVR